jgi:ssDNA-binding Zn-finger/Zn-ribbon topoisomerase 1
LRVSSTHFINTHTGFRNALNYAEEVEQAKLDDFVMPPCPYCGSEVKLRDSKAIYGRSFGFMWICTGYPVCDSYVGCHRNSNKPLGTLANAPTRKARMRAHKAFDHQWKSGAISRKDAYRLLREKMGLSEDDAHIAKFDINQCNKVVDIFRSPDAFSPNL